MVDVLTEGLGHCAVSFVGMHDRREYILLAANYLHGGFVDVSIEPLGKLVAAVVVEVRRVHVKHQLAIAEHIGKNHQPSILVGDFRLDLLN